MLGGPRLTFSYEKICQDMAGLAILLFAPFYIAFWERFSVRPLVVIPAFLISEFLLGITVFQLAYRGLWKFVGDKFKRRLRYSLADQTPESSIKSYSELISCWQAQRSQ
jgi:hypothetical protein